MAATTNCDGMGTRKHTVGRRARHASDHPQAPESRSLRWLRSGTGPVAQPVFKTGAAWQPHARSVRLRRRSAEPKLERSEPSSQKARSAGLPCSALNAPPPLADPSTDPNAQAYVRVPGRDV